MAVSAMAIGIGGGSAAGDLNPTAPPGSTMKTLDDVPGSWSRSLDSTNGVPSGPTFGCNSSRFECTLGNTVVLDRETGLAWVRTPNATNRPQFDAAVYCATAHPGGVYGWRLPTISEIGTLPDPNESSPTKLPSQSPFILTDGVGSTYWTSTPYPGSTSQYFFITFQSPTVGISGQLPSVALKSWCVRGPE